MTHLEHRNLPLNEGIGLIHRDYCNFVGLKDTAAINYQSPVDNANLLGGNQMPQQQQPGVYNGPSDPKALGGGPPVGEYGAFTASGSKPGPNSAVKIDQLGGGPSGAGSSGAGISGKLPDEVRYALRSTLEDNSAQFLSLSQFDLVINFYQREREKLTAYQKGSGSGLGPGSSSVSSVHGEQSKENLLENPQVKAALNSLFQMGAINTSALSKGPPESSSPYMNGGGAGAGPLPSSATGVVAYPGMAGPESSNYMYEANSFKSPMMNTAPSSAYPSYHDAPSYLSTDPASGPITGDMFAPNPTSHRRMESPSRNFRSVRPSRFQ